MVLGAQQAGEVAARAVVRAAPHHHFLGYPGYVDNADIELFTSIETFHNAPVAPSLRCIMFLTVLFFSVYLMVIIVRACRSLASCLHDNFVPLLMKSANALTLVPMLCILIISARQRATQLNPVRGDPQPWAQTCMYGCVLALLLRVALILAQPAETAQQPLMELDEETKARQCVCQQFLNRRTPLSILHQVGQILVSIALYGCCAAIVIAIIVMERPSPRETPPLTPMMMCAMILTVLYLVQYVALEISNICGPSETCSAQAAADAGPQAATAAAAAAAASSVLPPPNGDAEADDNGGRRGVARAVRKTTDEAYFSIEPVTLQFIPMFCVLLTGISLRAVQLNLQPDKWMCVAMFLTTLAIVVQAMMVPMFKFLLPDDLLLEVSQLPQENEHCVGVRYKNEVDQARLPIVILTTTWALLMVCLYIGIAGTLASVFAMEAEPLDVVWPEKQIGLLEAFLRHLEKSRHLEQEEALQALSTAAVPPISSAMRCTMLLTVLYFGVFLGLLVGRSMCGPARKRAIAVGEAIEQLQMADEQLQHAMKGLRERESRSPELADCSEDQEKKAQELKEQVALAKEALQEQTAELRQAQSQEAQVREGIQRSLAFVPMLCVIMIGVRMRAMQIRIRDPQPWAQVVMYVATASVSVQVIASITWACFVKADDIMLSCGEVGLVGKVSAILILIVRYLAAACLYVAMIALVVALVSMQ